MPIKLTRSKAVVDKFKSYPPGVRKRMEHLRTLIITALEESENIGTMEESLKWGEPSFKTPKGSPIRIDWKEKAPDRISVYFNCNTNLVETFKKNHGDLFRYEKNRAIHFLLDETVPEEPLKHCLHLALNYHRLKDQPFLGT